MADVFEGRWLLLIHQIPPKPDYFRVKVRRRLQRVGAVAIKNTVYVLPKTEQTLEDFQWIVREIVEGGGETTLCEASFVEGMTDAQVEALFQAAREADYSQVAEEARCLMATLPGQDIIEADQREQIELNVARLKRRLGDIAAIDFFSPPGHGTAEGLLTGLEARLRAAASATPVPDRPAALVTSYCGRTWVTRKGIHIDRIASAWLISRFIDPEARFKFVSGKQHRSSQDDIRFDMFEAEFTHEGDRCTFEVLLERLDMQDQALRHMAEIVHDIDLKDAKFSRPEVPGLSSVIVGLAMAHPDDDTRLSRGSEIFDALYAFFTRKREYGAP
ncbi:MAG: chromate resistance protein ChrB domain-containing protein [Candidatus Tectomicrobia bacterium]